jgi:hypothetical protein
MTEWQWPGARPSVQARSDNLRSLVRPACSQHFLFFTGAAGMIGGMNPVRFLKQSGLGRRNVTLVRDPHRNNYRQGIGGDINDRDALAKALADAHGTLGGPRQLYCIGNSSGSFGALFYGHQLAADQVWAFSPRTARLMGNKETKEELLAMLSDWNGKSRYHLIYDPDNPIDRNFSELYAACPGVELMPLEGYGGGHDLMLTLAEQGKLPGMFPTYTPCD